MFKPFIALCSFTALLLLPLALNAQDASFEKRQFKAADGKVLPYRILLPEDYEPGKRYPLLLFLHAAGERGADNEAQLRHGGSLFLDRKVRRDFPAIVVFPQCPAEAFWTALDQEGNRWSAPFTMAPRPALQRTIELLAELERTEAVDKQRIYLMGLSMGGFAVVDLAARFPKRFAAAVPIAGGGNPLLAPLFAGNTAFWIFHGAKDKTVAPLLSRQLYEALQQAGAEPRYTEYPEAGHESWNAAFAEKELLEWLFSRRLSAGKRYKRAIFGKVRKDTYAYSNTAGQVLELDVYRPQGDAAGNRTCLLYVHGGGFSGGRRDEPVHIQFAERLARMGFVAVSMSYRLTMKGQSFSCGQPAANKIRTFQAAVEDIRQATNYLVNNKDKLGIDSEKIVLAGSSAGAEAVLHAAYWRDQDLPNTSPKLGRKFQYGGVISMAGALVDTSLISTKRAIPTLLFHGTCDPLVPYATAPHHYCRENDPGYLMLHGAYSIAQRLRHIGRPFYLVSSCNGQHEWNILPAVENFDDIISFLNTDVMGGEFRQVHRRYVQDDNCQKGYEAIECESPIRP